MAELSALLDLLAAAAADGHTWVPLDVVDAAGLDWRGAFEAGEVTGVVVDGVRGLAEASLAAAEEAVADELVGLVAEQRVALALGDPHTDAALVIPAVHRMPLAELAAALQQVPQDVPVVLAGDPDVLPGPHPGAVLRDAAASGLLPVRDARQVPDGALGVLVSGLRAGQLAEPDPADRSVVVVVCEDDAAVVHRAGQLLTTSVPKAFDIPSAEVVVATVQHRGMAGRTALAAALGPQAQVVLVHEMPPSAPAVVLCLPGETSGLLSRALLLTAASAATRHLSVVTAVGPALPQAVATVAHRPVRRTRLLGLLREGAEDLR